MYAAPTSDCEVASPAFALASTVGSIPAAEVWPWGEFAPCAREGFFWVCSRNAARYAPARALTGPCWLSSPILSLQIEH